MKLINREAFLRGVLAFSLVCGSCLCVSAAHAAANLTDDMERIPKIPLDKVKNNTKQAEALATISLGGDVNIGYVDNVFRSPTNKQGDTVLIATPSVEFRASDDTYDFKANAQIEVGRYASKDESDYVDARLMLGNKYHLNDNVSFLVNGELRRDHIGIGALDDEPDRQSSEPTTYTYGEAGAAFDLEFGRYKHEFGTTVAAYDYNNTTRLDGTQNINDDRDRKEHIIGGKSGVYIKPEIFTYVTGEYNTRSYDKRIDSSLLYERNSSGYTVAVGTAYQNQSFPINADGYIGYLQQNYDAAFLQDISGLAVGADIEFEANDKTAVKAKVTRQIRETTLTDTSGYLQSRVKLGAEHMFNDVLKLFVNTRYTLNDFEVNNQNGVADREDKVIDFTLGFDYELTKDYVLGASYTYLDKNSDSFNSDYDASQVFLNFSIKQ